MEGLPAEILQEIVGYLSREDDLDSVRLVNHKLSSAANLFKYRTLRVPVSRKGLDHLLYVSQQPALANCIRKIIYPWGHLSPVVNVEDVPRVPDEPSYDLEYNARISEIAEILGLAPIFQEWYNNKVYTTQTVLEDSGECVAALEAALPRMPNIRVLQPGFCRDDIVREFYEWRGTLTGTGSGHIERDWDKIWGVLRVYPNPTKDSDVRFAKHILDFIEVSHRVRLKPDGFGSRITGESPVLRPTFFSDRLAILQNCAPLMENLTSISFTLNGPHKGDKYIDREGLKKTFKVGRLHKFLASATNLRFLSLGLSWSNSLNKKISLLDIFGRTHVWKRLHTLHFDAAHPVNVKDLANFLGRHSETLEVLYLSMNRISGGTIRDLLDYIKERLHLKKFKIWFVEERLLYARRYDFTKYLERMEAYVLHGGPPFPSTEQELEEEWLGLSFRLSVTASAR
ncbi:hypothetical protein RUND412_011501 [Rhizina undulata]